MHWPVYCTDCSSINPALCVVLFGKRQHGGKSPFQYFVILIGIITPNSTNSLLTLNHHHGFITTKQMTFKCIRRYTNSPLIPPAILNILIHPLTLNCLNILIQLLSAIFYIIIGYNFSTSSQDPSQANSGS